MRMRTHSLADHIPFLRHPFQPLTPQGFKSLECTNLSDLIVYLETSKLPDHNGPARSLLLTIDDYFLSDEGLLFHLWTPQGRRRATTYQQLVVPPALRYELLVWAHDDPTGGHFGTVKTYEKLRTRYYWRKMFSDVNHWCRSCCDCAMRKSPRNRHKVPLLPIPVQDAFDRLACDIIGPFPPSKLGNRYVVVFSEYLTKWVEAKSIVRANIARTQQLMKLQYDKTSDDAPFEIGQRVWIFYLIVHADVYISRAAIAYVCSLFKQFSLCHDSASIRQMNQRMLFFHLFLFFHLCLFFAQIKF